MVKPSKEDADYARPSSLKDFLTSTVPAMRKFVEDAVKEANKPTYDHNQQELLKVSLDCYFKLFDEEHLGLQKFVFTGNASPGDVTKMSERRRMLMKTLVAKDPNIEPLIRAMDKVAQYAASAELGYMLCPKAVRGTAWGLVETVLEIL